MMRDYKSPLKPRRRKRSGLVRTLLGVVVLAAAFVAVGSISLGKQPASSISGHTLTLPALAEPAHSSGDMAADVSARMAENSAEQAPAEFSTDAVEPRAELPLVTTEGPSLLVDFQPVETADLQAAELTAAQAESDPVVTQGPVQALESLRWVEHHIASGDSISRIFAAQGLEASLLHRIVNSGKEAAQLANIRPGELLRLQYDESRELVRLELQRSRIDSLKIAITDEAIIAEEVSRDVDRQIATAAGLIEASLFLDGQKAGLSDAKIMELAAIFGWDIDFALEIRAGDAFRIVYEEHLLEGEKLRDGPILAAEFTNRGNTFRAVRYEHDDGEVSYYDPDGQSKRRAFIRTPIKFARVSSGFNPKRWHPVHKTWRAHRGVDYAAPTGTPVKATGDGRVAFRGTKGGYGKTVILEHAGKYTTLYAHLSNYSPRAKSGARVKQGQVIGYVGMTGVATGPHLHYEFRVNGVHQNPLTVKLPKSIGLAEAELPRFRATTAPLIAKLESIPAETMLASAARSETF